MNFIAHGEVARRLPGRRDDLTLGAMLPDLTHMVPFRVTRERLPASVAAGWDCHVAADKVFHADDRFRSAVAHMGRALVGAGWKRWPAHAAAHMSWELLLDGFLARRSDPSAWFMAALRCRPFLDCLDPTERSGWDRLIDGQSRQPLWTSYLQVEGVADRTWRRLSATRLAFPPRGVADLSGLLTVEAGGVADAAEDLLRSACEVSAD